MAVGLFQITFPETLGGILTVTIIESLSAGRPNMVDPCFNCQELVRMDDCTTAMFSVGSGSTGGHP